MAMLRAHLASSAAASLRYGTGRTAACAPRAGLAPRPACARSGAGRQHPPQRQQQHPHRQPGRTLVVAAAERCRWLVFAGGGEGEDEGQRAGTSTPSSGGEVGEEGEEGEEVEFYGEEGEEGYFWEEDEYEEEDEFDSYTELESLPWSPELADVYVAWDAHSVQPPRGWARMVEAVPELRSAAETLGRVESVVIFAGKKTFEYAQMDVEYLQAEEARAKQLESLEQQPLSPLFGKRCKSVEHMQKHFEDLHEREHLKRLRGGRQRVIRKYIKSEKAERYREARVAAGLGFGRAEKGPTLKTQLWELGVHCREWLQSPRKKGRRNKGVSQAAEAACWNAWEDTTVGALAGSREEEGQQETGRPPRERVLLLVSDRRKRAPLLARAKECGWRTAVATNTPRRFDRVPEVVLPWVDVCPLTIEEYWEDGEEEDEFGEYDDTFSEGWWRD